jgi:hypothetical protein
MKKYMMLLLISASPMLAQVKSRHDRISIDSPALRLVDGSSFIDIENMMAFGKNIILLQKGGKKSDIEGVYKKYNLQEAKLDITKINWSSKEKSGLFYFDGDYWSLEDLVKLEKNIEQKHQTARKNNDNEAIAHYQKYKEQMRELFSTTVLRIFEKFSAIYLEEIKVGKKYMVKLIKRWSEIRSRNDSELLRWDQIANNEHAELKKRITSFKEFDVFLSDLRLLLADLIQNCPKSYSQYLERRKNNA